MCVSLTWRSFMARPPISKRTARRERKRADVRSRSLRPFRPFQRLGTPASVEIAPLAGPRDNRRDGALAQRALRLFERDGGGRERVELGLAEGAAVRFEPRAREAAVHQELFLVREPAAVDEDDLARLQLAHDVLADGHLRVAVDE